MSDFVIRSTRVLADGRIAPASVRVRGERIERVAAYDDVAGESSLIDAGDAVVMPSVIDTHVHVNEPGRTEWEGFASATRAAAAGGVTTILDMPLNSIPATTSVAALEAKRAAARGKCVVNVEFIGGIIPGNAGEVVPLADAGVRAFKCFLTPSGVDEFPCVGESDLRDALPQLAKRRLPLMVHAELPSLLRSGSAAGSRVYRDYLSSRPAAAEREAIAMMIRLLEWCPTPVHIVHVSSATSLDMIADARARGLPITAETCPHYLTFCAEEIPDGTTEFKCAPPIRERHEREGLWKALVDDRLDLVASDHSPCPPSMKATHGDFFSAWGGIASLQLALPVVWTGAKARGIPLMRVIQWMCESTARLAGLSSHKGRIGQGYDADLVIFDPDASFRVDPARLKHRHAVTPYAGRELFGIVERTCVGGRWVFERVS